MTHLLFLVSWEGGLLDSPGNCRSMAEVPRMRWRSAGMDEWWGMNAFRECMNIESILCS